ncbi:hypothetical protein [Bdellovibrio reynosensis]|uniref:Uncharacterized protein n=1 Tax=Bdellovibrio reynosensis TaxID=2835041 RepID=A0ABY4CCM7_9BACT|nr:hypothetical protein [Bdellovibrio reynosensis]UOE99949.1 hypothetical protein MNR06_09585 [Bdellovibrio reynosensis]
MNLREITAELNSLFINYKSTFGEPDFEPPTYAASIPAEGITVNRRLILLNTKIAHPLFTKSALIEKAKLQLVYFHELSHCLPKLQSNYEEEWRADFRAVSMLRQNPETHDLVWEMIAQQAKKTRSFISRINKHEPSEHTIDELRQNLEILTRLVAEMKSGLL